MTTKNKVVKGGLKKVKVCDFCNTESKPLKKCASCGRDTCNVCIRNRVLCKRCDGPCPGCGELEVILLVTAKQKYCPNCGWTVK
jgi:hypothetical protein